MAKIENTTVYPTVTPSAEDLLIATDVSNNNETVTFLVSDLLGQSTLQGLQSVLDVNNTAIQNMNLTGNATFNGTIIPTTITAGGGVGSAGQVLTSTGVGLQWSNVALNQNLQQTLDNGNSATGVNMNIDNGIINVTNGGVVLDNASYLTVGGVSNFNSDVNLSTTLNFGSTTTLSDSTGAVGTPGQVLTVNAAGTGVIWSSSAGSIPTWQQVLNAGNTANNIGVVMTGNGDFSTSSTNTMTLGSANTYSGTNTFNSTVEINGILEDGAGNFGTAGQILAVNSAGTGVEWVNAASATAPTLQIVLDNGNTAAQNINLTGDIDLTGQLYFQPSSTINAGGSIGVNGQVLTSTGGGVQWSNITVNPTLNDVLTNGNTSAQSIVLTGSSTITVPTLIPTYIQDNSGATGSSGQVLSVNSGGLLEWTSVSGSSVTSVTAVAGATSTGNPLTISPTTGLVTVASNAYGGGANVGHVPSGGLVGQYLDGTGAWVNVPSGGGTMSSFDITDGAANTQTINDGNTISFLVGTPAFSAGTGLTATVSATDTLTLVNTGITNITAGADIGVSISATGEATISYTGGAAVYSWNIGDNSSTSAVTNGDTVNIIGGTGITSTLSGDDITLDTTAVLTESVATGVSTGAPLSASIAGNNLTLTSFAYAGGSNVGYVPTGGTAGTVLAGDGTWVSNSAGLASFGITGDTGSDTVDTLDNTLNILGTAPISTAVTATNNVTISHDTSGVAAGAYSYPSSVTVTAEGHVSAITSGTAPGTMDSWNLSGAGNNWIIDDGDYVQLSTTGSGLALTGTGFGTSVSPYELTFENTGVTLALAGTGISLNSGTGSVTITNDGVTSLVTTDGTYIDLTPDVATTGAVNVTADLSATGTADATTFLRGDNTWATPALSGTVVDSIQSSDGNITVTGDGGGPFTGNITLTYSGPTGTMSSWDFNTDTGGANTTISNGAVVQYLGGTGITTSHAAGTITITNDGVTDLTAIGAGISVSANTGAINISNTGVTSLIAGTGISLSGATGAVTITNTGTIGMTNWNLTADSGGTVTVDDAEYVTIAGGTNISTSIAGTGSSVDPFVLTIDSTSVISGTQNYIAKFTNATTVGDSRIYDAGVAGEPIGIDSTSVTTPSFGLAFGDNLMGIALQTNSNTTSFAVINEFYANTGDLGSNRFGRSNVLIAPTGLNAASPIPSTTNFLRNVVIGGEIAKTMTTETDCVLIGYNVHNGPGGPIPGDVVIGSNAAATANFTGGDGVNASILIGRNAAYSGAIKRGAIAIGDNVAYNGIGEGSTLLGVEVCYNTDSTPGAVVIGQNAGGGSGNNYTGELDNTVLIGNNAQATYTTENFRNGVLVGALSRSAYGDSIVLGVSVDNTAGPNTIHIGSSTVPTGVVTTQVNTSSKYWPVYINGVLQKVLLA